MKGDRADFVKGLRVESLPGRPWREIARPDRSFERGLSQVTADYSLRKDTRVKVVNRG